MKSINLARPSQSNVPGKQVWRCVPLTDGEYQITYGVLPIDGAPYVRDGESVPYPPLQMYVCKDGPGTSSLKAMIANKLEQGFVEE